VEASYASKKEDSREREREKGKTVYGRKKRTIASVTISVSVERYRRKKRDPYADGTRNVPLVIGTTGLFTFRAFSSLPTLVQVIRGRLRFRTLRLVERQPNSRENDLIHVKFH